MSRKRLYHAHSSRHLRRVLHQTGTLKAGLDCPRLAYYSQTGVRSVTKRTTYLGCSDVNFLPLSYLDPDKGVVFFASDVSYVSTDTCQSYKSRTRWSNNCDRCARHERNLHPHRRCVSSPSLLVAPLFLGSCRNVGTFILYYHLIQVVALVDHVNLFPSMRQTDLTHSPEC